MRLRTLPLSLAGVVLGTLLALGDFAEITLTGRLWTIVFLILTTLSLQILSNLSNELGDVQHGTDTADRQGPQYGLNGGEMTIGQMKALIGTFVGLCLVFGVLMIRFSFGTLMSLNAVLMLLLGVFAIKAAMSYTLGRHPYGYQGKGDIYVFLFFGLVAVFGAYFIVSGYPNNFHILLPGAAIGCFSVGVLNVNNIRDMQTDAANRMTVAIRLGGRRARLYQTALIVAGWLLMGLYFWIEIRMFAAAGYPVVFSLWQWAWVLTLPLFVLHLIGVWRRDGKALDPMLPLLVMSSFLLSCLAGVGHIALIGFENLI